MVKCTKVVKTMVGIIQVKSSVEKHDLYFAAPVKCLLKRAQSQLNSNGINETLETSKIMEALKRMIIPNGF